MTVSTEQLSFVEKLHAAIKPDTHVLAAVNRVRQAQGVKEYQIQIDVSKQASEKYVTRFVAPPPPKEKITVIWIDAPKAAKKEEAKEAAQPDEGDMP